MVRAVDVARFLSAPPPPPPVKPPAVKQVLKKPRATRVVHVLPSGGTDP